MEYTQQYQKNITPNIPGSTSHEEVLWKEKPLYSISRFHHRHRCRHASLQLQLHDLT